jgi:uncharacterized protein (DUF885 family)
MNKEASDKLLSLLTQGLKNEDLLTESDRAFLKARAGYIKQKHQDRLPSVFGKHPTKAIKVKKIKAKADPLAHPAAL